MFIESQVETAVQLPNISVIMEWWESMRNRWDNLHAVFWTCLIHDCSFPTGHLWTNVSAGHRNSFNLDTGHNMSLYLHVMDMYIHVYLYIYTCMHAYAICSYIHTSMSATHIRSMYACICMYICMCGYGFACSLRDLDCEN